MPAGRPLKYEDKEKLKRDIEEYFKLPKDEWTITGLALHLDCSRQTIQNYEGKPEFVDIVKRAVEMVEHSYETDAKKKGHAGTIFVLKNMGWKDKQEVENSGDQSLTVKWQE
jgi:hypothetical protein